MSNNQNNIQELFGLLSKWATLLPKEGEQKPPEDLYLVGKEIQQLCDIAERSSSNEKKEPETDFKPTFIFQLTNDDAINSNKPKFDCVYDFCLELKKYCDTSSKLNIEKDWLKLLLACSSHNYERFMWIHLTFQASNNLKLTWNQVRRRLQSKFDDPSRRNKLVQELESIRYIPEIQSIDLHNQKFLRMADELEYDIRDYYVKSLPEKFQTVLRSTMAFDDSKHFYYNLQDIQQRVVVFVNADEGKVIFYSKIAHVAVSLDHEKVNKSDCEFHLLAGHSTMNCPDYTIVKFPYMDCNGIPGVPDLLNIVLNTTPSKNNNMDTHIKLENDSVVTQQADPRLSKTSTDPRSNNTTQHPPTTPKAHQQKPAVTTQYIEPAGSINQNQQQTTFTVSHQQKASEEFSMIRSSHTDSTRRVVKAEASESSNRTISSPPRGKTRPRSPSPQYSSRNRSPSPKRRNKESSVDNRSLSPEVGCYIHGKHSNHTTKECRQAQLVIPSRRTSISPPPPPPPPRSSRPHDSGEKENICIFCGLPFKPGHLSYCKKVPPRKDTSRNSDRRRR